MKFIAIEHNRWKNSCHTVSRRIQLKIMNTIHTTEIFNDWFADIKDRSAKARIQMRIDREEEGNFGDHKSVGGGVSEMRINFGPGYRVYYTIGALKLSSFWRAAINQASPRTLRWRRILRRNYRGPP